MQYKWVLFFLCIYLNTIFLFSQKNTNTSIQPKYAEVQELDEPEINYNEDSSDYKEKKSSSAKNKNKDNNKKNKESKFDKDKLIYAANLGFSFRNGGFAVTLSPNVGYKILPYMSAGVGVNFQYYYIDFNNIQYSLGYIGPKTFFRLYPFRHIVVFTEPELNLLFGSERNTLTGIRVSLQKQWVPSMVTGIALASPNFGFTVSLGYDLIQHDLTPYPGLVFGLSLGFY